MAGDGVKIWETLR